jgi:hypothetical protein
LNETFAGSSSFAGNAESVTSKPVKWHVDGECLATSRSQAPEPTPMSAILTVDERAGMMGWSRKPRVLVVKMCCSSRLLQLVSEMLVW